MDELDDLVNSTVNVEDEKYKQFHSLFSSPTAVPPAPTPQPQQSILTQQQPQPQIQQQHIQQPQSIHQQQPIHRPQQPIQQPQHIQQQPQVHQQPQQPGQQAPPKPQGQTRTTITLTQSQQQHYLSLPNQQLQQQYLHQIRALQQNLINQQRTQQQQMGNTLPNQQPQPGQQPQQQPNGINNNSNMVSGGAKPIYMTPQQPGQQPQQPSIQKMPATGVPQMNNQQQPPQMNLPTGQPQQYTQQQINNMNAKQVIQQRPQVLNSPQPTSSTGVAAQQINNNGTKPMAIQQPSPTGVTISNNVVAQPGQTQLTPQQQQQLAIQKQQQQQQLYLLQQQQAAAQQRMAAAAGTTPPAINNNPQTPTTSITPITTSTTQAPSIHQQISQSFVSQQNGGVSTPPITSQQPQVQTPQQPPTQQQQQSVPNTEQKPVVDIQARVQNHFNALALAYRNAKIEKTTLMEHLVMLFGNGNAMNYAKKIDDIPTEKVPALPKDFDLETILKRTNDLRQMTIQYQTAKTQQQQAAVAAAGGKLPASNSLNDIAGSTGSINNNNAARLLNGQAVSATGIPLTKEQKKELAKQIKQQKKDERLQKKLNVKKAKDDRKANAQAAAIENKSNADNDNDDDKQNIKDLNDVTKIAGVDMKNESDQFLPDTNEEDETYAPETEPLFLNSYPLRKKITSIANKHGLKLSEENFLEFMSLATQDHLRTILEFLIKTSKQRVEMQKDEIPITFTTDVKKQLLAIEKREKDEKTKRETEENEKLMREAKEQELLNANNTSKKKVAPIVDDKSSNALKEKLSKIRMEKEEKDRTTAANSTAAIAVGNIGRRKPNLSTTSSTFMKSSLFTTANTQNIQPPIPNTQLISFQQLIREGKELTPEQEIEFQKLKDAYGLLLKQYHEKIGNKDYQPMDIDLIGGTTGSGGVTGNLVGGRAGANKQHPSRKITKKDCYFSQKHIGYNVLQKYELLKLRRRFNTNVFPF